MFKCVNASQITILHLNNSMQDSDDGVQQLGQLFG